jgi:hypothetical protein
VYRMLRFSHLVLRPLGPSLIPTERKRHKPVSSEPRWMCISAESGTLADFGEAIESAPMLIWAGGPNQC